MNENINDKVINIFKKANEAKNIEINEPPIKFFAGVNYVRIDEDLNGHPFKKDILLENAAKFSYIVRVLRPKNGKHSLYNYSVPFDKIVDFISLFEKNKLNGTIIEIDKYIPNELA